MSVESDAHIGVYLTPVAPTGADRVTVQDVKDWVAEVERLRIPSDTYLDECVLSVIWHSNILDVTENESELGVWGTDIIVGMPR
jgi:hypothetical protein